MLSIPGKVLGRVVIEKLNTMEWREKSNVGSGREEDMWIRSLGQHKGLRNIVQRSNLYTCYLWV